MNFTNLKILVIGILGFTIPLFLINCASHQTTTLEQVGRLIEYNPEQIWNASLDVLKGRSMEVVQKTQEDPRAWFIDTSFKNIPTREMRQYALSQYGYKPNIVTYMKARYKIQIMIEPISPNSCSLTLKFQPQLLASGTSDYAGQWEDAKSNGTFENDFMQSIFDVIGQQKP